LREMRATLSAALHKRGEIVKEDIAPWAERPGRPHFSEPCLRLWPNSVDGQQRHCTTRGVIIAEERSLVVNTDTLVKFSSTFSETLFVRKADIGLDVWIWLFNDLPRGNRRSDVADLTPTRDIYISELVTLTLVGSELGLPRFIIPSGAVDLPFPNPSGSCLSCLCSPGESNNDPGRI
jgi:hypothetical protein